VDDQLKRKLIGKTEQNFRRGVMRRAHRETKKGGTKLAAKGVEDVRKRQKTVDMRSQKEDSQGYHLRAAPEEGLESKMEGGERVGSLIEGLSKDQRMVGGGKKKKKTPGRITSDGFN